LLWIVLGGAGFLLTSRSKAQSFFWAALALILTAAVLFIPQQRETFPHRTAFRVIWALLLSGFFFARRARLGDRLPGWLAQIEKLMPLTHGIAAARELAGGAALGSVSDLVWTELGIGATYAAISFALVRFFEFEGRRRASLETY